MVFYGTVPCCLVQYYIVYIMSLCGAVWNSMVLLDTADIYWGLTATTYLSMVLAGMVCSQHILKLKIGYARGHCV